VVIPSMVAARGSIVIPSLIRQRNICGDQA
jgi:hypothetical protein